MGVTAQCEVADGQKDRPPHPASIIPHSDPHQHACGPGASGSGVGRLGFGFYSMAR